MNKLILIGRLTRDPDIITTQTTTMAKYTLAVDRRFKKDGEQSVDFISCITFGKSAEFAEKYLKKGTKVAVVGRIQTGSYTNRDGNKVYTTDVVVEEHEFAESKGQPSTPDQTSVTSDDDFMSVPDGLDSELPFV